jgi:hypothetical protein
MQRKILEKMTPKALLALAHELGVSGADSLTKKRLVEALLAAPEDHGAAETMDQVAGAPGQPSPASYQPKPEAVGAPVSNLGMLPERYGKTRVVLMTQKPRHMYAYWEVTDADLDRARAKTDGNFHMVLRVYETPGTLFHDIEVCEPVGEWFFTTSLEWQSLRVEIGLRTADGRFVTIIGSEPVVRPAYRPSDRTDPEWSIQEGDFQSIYALSGGLSRRGGSENVQRVIREGGWAPSSPGSPFIAR